LAGAIKFLKSKLPFFHFAPFFVLVFHHFHSLTFDPSEANVSDPLYVKTMVGEDGSMIDVLRIPHKSGVTSSCG